MSTWSLVRWVALVAGAELAVRGHLADRGLICHAGAVLFGLALAALLWPTRARRLGVAAAAAVGGLVAIDVALAAGEMPGPPPPPARSGEPVASSASDRAHARPAAGSAVIFVVGGAPPADLGESGPPWTALLEESLRERYDCARSVAVVDAAARGAPLPGVTELTEGLAEFHPVLVLVLAEPELLDAVLDEAPALRFGTPEALGPRASPLGRAGETRLRMWARAWRWRRAVATEPALDPRSSPVAERYRDLVLAARRAGADVALLVPSLAVSVDAPEAVLRAADAAAPHARDWILANRAHAHLVRAIAGSYGIRAIDTRPGLDGTGREAFADLGHPNAAGRARLAATVAAALAEPLARASAACHTRAQNAAAER